MAEVRIAMTVFNRRLLRYLSQAACLVPVLGLLSSQAFAQSDAQSRPRVIIGPSAVYSRGVSPSVVRSAGLGYQTGVTSPAVVPNYAFPSYQPATYGGTPFLYGSPTPYGATVYGAAYPGYGFGYGSGYGALGYNFNYPGMTVGYGYLGAPYAPAGTGYVAPTWYYQQMQGFYRR